MNRSKPKKTFNKNEAYGVQSIYKSLDKETWCQSIPDNHAPFFTENCGCPNAEYHKMLYDASHAKMMCKLMSKILYDRVIKEWPEYEVS